jgi:ribonuclease Y
MEHMTILIIGWSALALVIGGGLGFYIRKRFQESQYASLQTLSQRIVEEAKKEAETIRKEASLQAKDTLYQMKLDFDKETRDRRLEMQEMEKRILIKEQNQVKNSEQLDKKELEISQKEQGLDQKNREMDGLKSQYQSLIQQEKAALEKISSLTSQEAKELLIKSIESEARMEASKIIKRIENETREVSDKKAKEIIALAVKRYSGDYVSEKTVSVVTLPSDEMKGRIIGREGRNIRAIEAATGVDLIIDDTPEAVIVSAFNPLRREVARLSLERLIGDGRIHPARIEEIVKKVSQELDVTIRETGEQATFDVGVHGIHPELIKLIGKLRYRSSYSQNVLQHSLEVAFLAGIIAAELNVNIKQAKRAGLLHDIGKAVDHEVEGSHAAIGADLAKKYGESPRVIHAVSAHHEEIPPENVLDVIIQAADTLSGARPGARREMLATYVKRLEDLERIAQSFKGVSKSYAIQAGREIRIMVESDRVGDAESVMLSRDIARKIEEELAYPGQIKVTVIREVRAVEYAK